MKFTCIWPVERLDRMTATFSNPFWKPKIFVNESYESYVETLVSRMIWSQYEFLGDNQEFYGKLEA